MASAFVQIFVKSLRACSGISVSFAALESLNTPGYLGPLKSPEGLLSVLTRMNVAAAQIFGARAGGVS
jgi:hypothetical protein